MTEQERDFIRMWLTSLVEGLRTNNPALTPGEIYDAVAKELERRCASALEAARGGRAR